jgi:hypothetical protein
MSPANADMQQRIERKVIGKKVVALSLAGRKCILEVEGGTLCTFTVIEDFELTTGEWRFVPNANPGRPKKKVG